MEVRILEDSNNNIDFISNELVKQPAFKTESTEKYEN